MEHITHLGVVPLPGVPNRVPLSINLHVGPRHTTTTGLAHAAALGRPEYVAISVAGEINGHCIDLGVRAEVDVSSLPTTIEDLAATEPVADLIADFGQRLADLTWYLTVSGLAFDDRIAAGFTVDDIEFLRQCLTNLERHWREGIDAANAAARRPQRDTPPSPGFINIEPTPSGYRGIACLTGAELTRVMDHGKRLERLLDLARQAAGDDADQTVITAPDLIPAIRRAGDLLASAHEGLGHLGCGEIQGVIDLLLAAGLRDTAIDVITSHAMGDDDADDVHHHIYLAMIDDDGDPNELAGELADAQLRGEPLLKWRNLLPNGEVVTYATRNARDDHAPHLAKAWKATILTELWDSSHPQDELNQGWATDGTVEPTP